MVTQRRIPVAHADVFPEGAFLKGEVEAVLDFDAKKRDDGSRPQATDQESGLLVWQVMVLDADDQAGKKDIAVAVKFSAKHQPVPPENTSGLPWTPVEFDGLTATAWVDDNGFRPRLAWSYRAQSMQAPAQTPWPNASSGSSGSGTSGKAAG